MQNGLNIETNEASVRLLEQALSYWVKQVTAAAIEFNEQLIKEKGKEFAKLLAILKRMDPKFLKKKLAPRL